MAVEGASAVEVEIDGYKTALGAATDSDFATIMGLQRSTIAQWKKRAAIPESARRRIAWTIAHRQANETARSEFAKLPVTQRHISRAIALLYVVRSTEVSDLGPQEMLNRALFLDEIERAASMLLAETMEQERADAGQAYQALFALEPADFETRLTAILMPARAG